MRILFGLVRGALVAGAMFLFHATPGVLLAGFSSPALADCSVGGDNQRPCRIWERIPSCNKGLVEDFRTDRCVKPEKQSYYNVCGGENKRPCTVVEAFPSCHPGLVEDFGRNQCVKRDKDCGKQDGTPCLFTERLPSCDPGLVEDFVQHKCVPSGLTQASCRALVAAISSGVLPPGLKEYAAYATQRARGRDRDQVKAMIQSTGRIAGPAVAPVVDDLKPFISHVMNPDNRRAIEELFSADSVCGDIGAGVTKIRNLMRAASAAAPAPPRGAAAAVSAKGGSLPTSPDRDNPASLCTYEMQLPPFRDAYQRVKMLRSNGSCFVAVSFGFSVAAIGGGAAGYTWVIGPKGDSSDSTVFFYLGIVEVTNITVGIGPTVTIYPSMRPADFPGWFVEDGLTAGLPTPVTFFSAGPRAQFNAPSPFSAKGAAADFACTPGGLLMVGVPGVGAKTFDKLCKTNFKLLQFAGAGVGASLGGSVSPIDVGTSVTYSWPLYVDWNK